MIAIVAFAGHGVGEDMVGVGDARKGLARFGIIEVFVGVVG